MKKVLLVLLVVFTALLLFGCDELIGDFDDALNGGTTEVTTLKESTTVKDDPIVDLFSGEIAKIIIEDEKKHQEEIDQLHNSKPGYTFSFLPIDSVYCAYSVQGDSSAEKIVEKYNLREVFYKAEVNAYNKTKTIYITFKRDDFTQNVHDELYRIADGEILITNIYVSLARGTYRDYMPQIEYFAPDATAIDYTTTSTYLSLLPDNPFIIKTKEEYDARIEQLLELYNYQSMIDAVNEENAIYTDDFFENNTLLLTEVFGHGSSSIKHTIDNVYVLDNKLYVVVKTNEPNGQSEDVVNYRFNIAVSKEDIEGIDEVIVLH